MKNILMHELFKIKKSKYVYIVLGIALALACFFPLLETLVIENYRKRPIPGMPEMTVHGVDGLDVAGGNNQIIIIMALVMITSLFVTEYNRGTMRNLIMSGHDRAQVFIIKALIGIAFSVVIFLINYICATLIYTIYGGWGSVDAGKYILTLVQVLFLTIATASATIFFAELTRNTGATMGIVLGLVFVSAIVGVVGSRLDGFTGDLLTTLSELFVGVILAPSADVNLSWYKAFQYTTTSIVTIFVTFTLGLLSFQHRDAK